MVASGNIHGSPLKLGDFSDLGSYPTMSFLLHLGWGFQEESGTFSPKLREIRVPIVPTIVCNGILHYFGRVDSLSMLCAGAGGADACQVSVCAAQRTSKACEEEGLENCGDFQGFPVPMDSFPGRSSSLQQHNVEM